MDGEYFAAFMEALADAIKYGFLADMFQMNLDAFERLVEYDGT